MKTRKLLLLSAAMMLSMVMNAQTPTGPWSAYENDGINHYNPTVLYKTSPDGDIYVIPAWDKRLMDNGYVRARKKVSDGSKAMIVTAMGLLYDEDGFVEAKQKYGDDLYVWSEIKGDWVHLETTAKIEALHYSDLFVGGSSINFVFKDSKNVSYGTAESVSGVYTIPSTVPDWGNAGGVTGEIDEIGIWGYGNGNYSNSTANRSKITQLTIPSTIKKIGDYAFRGINTLETVVVEDGVTSIPDRCFDVCWNLKSVTLPRSITSIGGAAFGGCGSLNHLIFSSTEAPTFGKFDGKNIFTTPYLDYDHSDVVPAKCIIEVPLGSAKDYVTSNDGILAQFPLSSKFPMAHNLITYCSDLEFTFKQYNTSNKTWSDGSVQVYYAEDGDVKPGKVMMTEITGDNKIPSMDKGEYFGVLLKGTKDQTYDIFYPNNLITNTFSSAHGNYLKGVITDTPINPNAPEVEDFAFYVLSSDGKFHRVKTPGTLGANKAYLLDEDGSNDNIGTTESTMSVTLPGDETGIEILLVEDEADDAVYTLQGTKVSQSHKGLVIQNGKKYIVR